VPEFPSLLAAYQGSGYVVAPAGFGKTHLIAASLLHATKRQLVLTHTYAGVNALRKKMRQLKVPSDAHHVDTIASWALRLALSYQEASAWTIVRPGRGQWAQLYGATTALLDCAFIRRIIRASYGGLYVDEYQDCSVGQHQLVLKLASDLPCRILGDPLQGIFDFNGDAIDWDRDVAGLERLGQLDTPHRWQHAGAEPALGNWLRDIRTALEKRQAIDLSAQSCRGLKAIYVSDEGNGLQIKQGNTCRNFQCAGSDTVIAIHCRGNEYKAKCHDLALRSTGRFSSIEEIEGKDVFAFVQRLERAPNAQSKLRCGLRFAAAAMTKVRESVPVGTFRGECVQIRENTRNPVVAHLANDYLTEPTSGRMVALLTAIRNTPAVHVGRADLYNRVIGVLRKHTLSPQLTLSEAAETYQTQFRRRGRTVGRRKLIGTTLLVKGLEFHHAIVLDAPSLSRKELYVALTRGSKSLTVISSSAILAPKD
jgi:hypothetical protein